MANPDAGDQATPVYAIIPAAGRSRRMGEPKQLLPYGQRTILETVIETLLGSPIAGLVVVTHTDIADELDLAEDPRFVTAINDDADSQMLDSIRMGIEAAAEAFDPPAKCGYLVCPGDMPGIDVATVGLCIRHFADDPNQIIVATCRSKRGHPVIVPASMTPEMPQLTDGGLNELLRRHPDTVQAVEAETPAVTKDIDTPDDYADSAAD